MRSDIRIVINSERKKMSQMFVNNKTHMQFKIRLSLNWWFICIYGKLFGVIKAKVCMVIILVINY